MILEQARQRSNIYLSRVGRQLAKPKHLAFLTDNIMLHNDYTINVLLNNIDIDVAESLIRNYYSFLIFLINISSILKLNRKKIRL